MESLDYRKRYAHYTLKYLWFLLTLIVIFFVSYYLWLHYKVDKQELQKNTIEQISIKFDEIIDKILYSIHELPLYGRDFENCTTTLLPSLHTLTFNNNFISGAVLSNKQGKIICSTLNKTHPLPPFPKYTPALLGPLTIDSTKVSTFLLVQQIGEFYIGVYIVKDVFSNLIRSVVPADNLIILLDEPSNKEILMEGDVHLLASINDPFSRDMSELTLLSLENIKLIDLRYPSNIDFAFYRYLFPFILMILMISWLIYFQLRKLLNYRNSLQYALLIALKKKQFQPVYQPIIAYSDNKFCGAEVLLRWKTLDQVVMPDSFIVNVEQSGLIVPISLQLIAKALKECQYFLKNHSYFYLAFNLSTIHFSNKDFFQEFYKLCENYEISSKQIMLEITERELLDKQNPTVKEIMRTLRRKGFSMAVDDFGTGHASFPYLQNFPFNYLKIDKMFIEGIGTGAITETLNEGIIHIARSLKLNIIAEGVESKEQVDFLVQNKINFMQGWYFSKALSYENLVKLVEGEAQ